MGFLEGLTNSGFEHKKTFQAEGESWRYEDPNPMISSGAAYNNSLEGTRVGVIGKILSNTPPQTQVVACHFVSMN